MDPNAALDAIRKIIYAHQLGNGGEDLTPDEVSRLYDLVEGLDQWMSKGGFLPTAWQR